MDRIIKIRPTDKRTSSMRFCVSGDVFISHVYIYNTYISIFVFFICNVEWHNLNNSSLREPRSTKYNLKN